MVAGCCRVFPVHFPHHRWQPPQPKSNQERTKDRGKFSHTHHTTFPHLNASLSPLPSPLMPHTFARALLPSNHISFLCFEPLLKFKQTPKKRHTPTLLFIFLLPRLFCLTPSLFDLVAVMVTLCLPPPSGVSMNLANLVELLLTLIAGGEGCEQTGDGTGEGKTTQRRTGSRG